MMKPLRNWTLLPWAVLILVTAAAACAASGLQGGRLAGLFVLTAAGAAAGYALLYLLILCVISLTLDTSTPPAERSAFCAAMVTYVEGLLPAFFRVRIYASGLEKVPADRPWLLVGNHRSGFDPLITGWALRNHRLAFVLKPSIRSLPVVGPFVHRACYLAIDRENDRAALKTILQAIKLIKENVVSIAIYPEGTRNTGEGLLPFRNGAFKIAQKAHAPIVIAAVRNTAQITRRFPWRSTDVYLDIVSVLDAEDAAQMSTAEIGDTVRAQLLSALAPQA